MVTSLLTRPSSHLLGLAGGVLEVIDLNVQRTRFMLAFSAAPPSKSAAVPLAPNQPPRLT